MISEYLFRTRDGASALLAVNVLDGKNECAIFGFNQFAIIGCNIPEVAHSNTGMPTIRDRRLCHLKYSVFVILCVGAASFKKGRRTV